MSQTSFARAAALLFLWGACAQRDPVTATQAPLDEAAPVDENGEMCVDPPGAERSPDIEDVSGTIDDFLPRPPAPIAYTTGARGSIFFDRTPEPVSPALTSGGTTSEREGAGGNEGPDGKATPGSTCEDYASIAFGPRPAGMPAFNWPEFPWCTPEECVPAALGYANSLHNYWRLMQMFSYMASMAPAQRAWAWDRPGVDAFGNMADERTAPAAWFGAYSEAKFVAVFTGVAQAYWILRDSEVSGIDLKVSCIKEEVDFASACFTAQWEPLGNHWVAGDIQICPRTWDLVPWNDLVLTWLVSHEALHHTFVNYGIFPFLLRDWHTHWHGDLCTSNRHYSNLLFPGLPSENTNLWGTPPLPYNWLPELLSMGANCNHDTKLITSVDAYAQSATTIGTLVKRGELVSWPAWAPQDPQPPTCVGGLGCLCETVTDEDAPDGDYAANKFCTDNDAPHMECMKVSYGAGTNVGICTDCEVVRGPGCACNINDDVPCDVGSCFGTDTGPGTVTGTCYREPPPSFACLANCEALLGQDAFCLTDHDGGARCVPAGTSRPEAGACWAQYGNHGVLDPDSNCIQYECGLNAGGTTCQQRGYPGIFVCNADSKCVPNP